MSIAYSMVSDSAMPRIVIDTVTKVQLPGHLVALLV